MNIIPVVDLLHGQVVHAKHGNRKQYQPIQSPLCPTSEPLAMVKAMMQLFPFQQLYIADLNAIQAIGHHGEIITKIQHQYPTLEIWLDAGFNDAKAIAPYLTNNVRPIIGSESIRDEMHYRKMASVIPQFKTRAILSLDFKDGKFIGPDMLIKQTDDWPESIIIMTLNKVGSQSGPDLTKISEIKATAHTSKLYAAGGVRNQQDLSALQTMGMTGVLVATALHSGQIQLTNS